MKKLFLGIVVLGLLWCNQGYSANLFDDIGPPKDVCVYKLVLNKTPPCDNIAILRKTLENPFFDLLKPKEISVQQWKNLVLKRIQEIQNSPEYKKKQREIEKQRKQESDLRCSILAGQANSWLAGRKIYKSCMKTEGY